MTRDDYLRTLQRNLKGVPSDEVYNIMEFYREYFEEAGPENEASVIAELGSPEKLALNASANYVIHDLSGSPHDYSGNTMNPGGYENQKLDAGNLKKKNNSSVKSLWIVILAICASPIWFPVGIAVAAVVFALVIVVAALIFSFGVCCAALTISGVAMFGLGVGTLFVNVPTGLFAIGYGLVSFGVGILLCIATRLIFIGCKRFILFVARKCVSKKTMPNQENQGNQNNQGYEENQEYRENQNHQE